MSNAKLFADRLNQCLNDTGAAASLRERSTILSRMLDISKHQAWVLLEGQQLPDTSLLEKIANEFEVDVVWLSGGKMNGTK